MKKFLKVVGVIIVTLAVVVYGGVLLCHKVFFREQMSDVPTIAAAENGTFALGVQAHGGQAKTVEEFLPVLAEQLKLYNEIAPTLWVDNAVVNQSMIVEKIDNGKLWSISPDGVVTPASKGEVKRRGASRNAYVDGFSFFDGGMYYALRDIDIQNVLDWQKYLHLGTHDAILFLTHEQFHNVEQEKWKYKDVIPNKERSEFLENVEARAKRDLLQRQLLRAVSEPGDEGLILEALATYEDWKVQFPEDYKNSYYFDRIEGAAYYYEIVSGLYIGYPEQIKDRDDLDGALLLLATREDVYVKHGLASESYIVGGFACVLLDRLLTDWQERLMSDPDATPIEMLARHFEGERLPAARPVAPEEVEAVREAIQEKKDVRPRLFRFIYDILF